MLEARVVDERPCKLCRREKDRRRVRSPNQLALKYVGARGRAWRKAKREYLDAVPGGRVCECDDPDCMEPATHVHHVDGLGPTGPRGLDPTNFRALSARCHAAHHSATRPRDERGWWVMVE